MAYDAIAGTRASPCVVAVLWSFSILFASSVIAEKYVDQSVLATNTRNVTVATESDCINSCLNQPFCSAVSICRGKLFLTCYQTNCANILYNVSTTCYTLIFVDLGLEGIDQPIATYEWILTDVCGSLRQANSGAQPATQVAAPSTASFTPTISTFFGNSFDSVNFSVTTGVLPQSINQSLAVFVWYKVNSLTDNLNLAAVTWITCAGPYTVSLSYSSGYLALNASTGCRNRECNAVVQQTILTGVWQNLAIVYNAPVGYIEVRDESSLKLLLEVPNAPLAANFRVSLGPFDGSAYCLKIFNTTLEQNTIAAVAKSCITGKSSCYQAKSLPAYNVVADTTLNGAYLVLNTINYANDTTMSWFAARQYCESAGMQLAQLERSDLAQAFSSLVQSTGSKGTWIGAVYNSTLDIYSWIASGVALVNSSIVYPQPSVKDPYSDHIFVCWEDGGYSGHNWTEMTQFACTSVV